MKPSLLLLLLLQLTTVAFSQSQGPNNPAAAATVPSSACLGCPGSEWSNEINVFLPDNNSATTVLQNYSFCFQSTCYYSRYLYASDFGFTIPANAVILGILTEVNRNPGNPNAVVDSTVRLFDGATTVGSNQAIAFPWANGFNYQSYGGPSDLWGSAWTPALINGAAFGLYFKIYNSSANVVATVSVDHVRMTVYYQLPTGIIGSQTMSAGGFSSSINESGNAEGSFILNKEASCSIELFSVTGTLLSKKDLGKLPAGKQKFEFSAVELSTGLYFLRLSAG